MAQHRKFVTEDKVWCGGFTETVYRIHYVEGDTAYLVNITDMWDTEPRWADLSDLTLVTS